MPGGECPGSRRQWLLFSGWPDSIKSLNITWLNKRQEVEDDQEEEGWEPMPNGKQLEELSMSGRKENLRECDSHLKWSKAWRGLVEIHSFCVAPQGWSWTRTGKWQGRRVLLKPDCSTWKGLKRVGNNPLAFLTRSLHAKFPPRLILNSATQLLFLWTTLFPHFSKWSLKLHLWSLIFRSYSDVNVWNILHCPRSGLIISCNVLLTNVPAGLLLPCCRSETCKLQMCIYYTPVALLPVDSWYPPEMAGSLTVTFKVLCSLTQACTLNTSNTACFGSTPTTLTPTSVPLHVLLSLTGKTLLSHNHPSPHQFHSTCYSFIRSYVQCHFCQEALSGSPSLG